MINKTHRTLLVADGESDNGVYAERINRLRESVNGENIKVDEAVATKHGIVAPHEAATAGSVDLVEQFRQALAKAKELGYDQLVFSADPRRA